MVEISFNTVIWIQRLLFIVTIVFSILFLITFFFNLKNETTDLRIALLANRILYSPDGITYNSPETDRAYPGIVDLQKFDSAHLETAIYYDDEDTDEKGNAIIAAKIRLLDEKDKEIKSLIYNEKTYNNIQPISFASGYRREFRIFYVLIYDNGKFTPAKLEMDIVTHKG
ncbi:MAG: hypothetical protein Q7J54_01455 [Candidatus Woesearchaeota archaeon]|nr:hypothetical protein [Candidatus Woesearchaeota archaeon]